ncbi:exodeoxyribonuclease V alpha subunit protein [Liberibacter crescens BT-1]|uniref:Exodeoxyribonuclease V alpha subunit protein n=1 Tax=Liberibacter crescens (strain BT-1) TaxID=1215343 RepID=L0EV18_LIBCB|nr:AAA family ATPase [Liberibacter crescens]AGA64807.1 exodeoxyribonuclease V alpha subunit protein [Liberibacter crescens BT-1]AMC12866.1 ATP-binding protein [Liberibacter crescens]
MQLSLQQENALKAVSRWYHKADSPIFRLFGYAGTGKTTLARYFSEHIDGDVIFAAFTGKAAQALRARGASGARTLHSLIYRPRGSETVQDDHTGKTVILPTFSINYLSPVAKASLVIVDECSMVDEQLAQDLMTFGTPILVLGDPGQLPPISGSGFFTNHEPDFMLTEIHRQARENPIIRLSMEIREGNRITWEDKSTVRMIHPTDVTSSMLVDADQILVGTNHTRRKYNKKLRQLKNFFSVLPDIGDKLVCLRNNPEKGLLNGSIWKVTTLLPCSRENTGITLQVKDDHEDLNTQPVTINLLKDSFENPTNTIPWTRSKRYDSFDYGYALTVHKAQGSQWNKVVLFDENHAFKEMRKQWLYTAVTRACEELILVC